MPFPSRRSSDDLEAPRSETLNDFERINRQLRNYLDSWRHLPDLLSAGFTPVADVEETDDAYLIEIELAGVKRDDVDIEVAGRRVSVRGERKQKERVGVLRKRERTVGRFEYEVVLPSAIDEEHVTAALDEGVLTVRLAKPQTERARRIEIH